MGDQDMRYETRHLPGEYLPVVLGQIVQDERGVKNAGWECSRTCLLIDFTNRVSSSFLRADKIRSLLK
jgi:hypothetical protein